MNAPLASVIITTYNWPAALELVIKAFSRQTTDAFELLIADDGSTSDTAVCIKAMQQQYPALRIKHVWQPDEGFRAAQIRNKAVAKASGDYIIFVDGDCIPRRHFIQHHLHMAETGYWVPGSRVFLRQSFTERVLTEKIPIHCWTLWQLWWSYCRREMKWVRHLFPWPFNCFRKYSLNEWREAQTCNLGVWRVDFLKVNGFDESYQGWGYEDSDLVIRLMQSGIQRKSGKFGMPVLHLWHPQNDQARRQVNYQKLMKVLEGNGESVVNGVNQYL